MVFRNLESEYHFSASDYFAVSARQSLARRRTDKEKEKFVELWRSGTAEIHDWVAAQEDDVKAAEEGLNEEQLEVVRRRKKRLYDLWLEGKVQHFFARQLKEVIRYTPGAVEEYCRKELRLIELAVTEDQTAKQSNTYTQYRFQENLPDFASIYAEVAEPNYQSSEDILSQRCYPEAEALARYREYLKKLIDEGIDAVPPPVLDPQEISLEALWPDLVQFSKEMTVEYRSRPFHYKEDSYVDYEVDGVSGCSVWSLRKRMDQLFDRGYEILLGRLVSMPTDEQQDVINDLLDQIRELSYLITEGEYVEEENEYGPKREYKFKRFKTVRYKGDRDLHFALNKSSRGFLDKKLEEYADTWLEGVQAMERKLEHLLNNLSLVNKLSVTFDVMFVFENVYIIESEAIACQGTAFHLKGVGIVTCDHCLRGEDDKLCTDAVIFKPSNIGNKLPVKIIKSNKDYDLAVLELGHDVEGFLGSGLERGSSDELERTDIIGVAGFPNYNYGDSGNFTTGAVSMFRTIKGIRHILVTNSLVEGNSGGPGINRNGQVVGVVTTGTSTFGSASRTEKHGLTPIELIDMLQRKDDT